MSAAPRRGCRHSMTLWHLDSKLATPLQRNEPKRARSRRRRRISWKDIADVHFIVEMTKQESLHIYCYYYYYCYYYLQFQRRELGAGGVDEQPGRAVSAARLVEAGARGGVARGLRPPGKPQALTRPFYVRVRVCWL